MKKILCISVALLLVLGVMSSASAQSMGFTEEQFKTLLGEDSFEPSFSRIRLIDDTFYDLEDDGNVYTWKIHDDSISLFCHVDLLTSDIPYELMSPEQKEKAEAAVTHLFSGEKQLWAYNILSGKAGIIADDGVRWGLPSDIKDEKWDPKRRDIIGGFAQGDSLFFAYDGNFCRLTPESGIGAELPLPINTVAFQPYKENMAITWNYENSKTSIYEINLADGKATQLKRNLPDDAVIIGIDYIATNDVLYVMTLDDEGNCKIYTSRQGKDLKFEGELLENGRIVNLNENEYALIQPSGISIHRIEDLFQTSKQVLTVRGIMSFPYVSQHFMNKNPNVIIREQSANFEQKDLVSILAGDSNVDIYAMFTNRLFNAVKDKGYAMKLDASDMLSKSADMMYPVFSNTIRDKDGVVVAWPTPFIVYKLMEIDSELWQECFGEREYPKTFIDMFEIMSEWENEYSSQYENAVVYLPGTLRSLLFQMVFKYCGMYEVEGEWIDFNTPIFQDSISAYEEMLNSVDLERMDSILNREDENNSVRALFWGEGLYAENDSFFKPEQPLHFTAWPTFDATDMPVIEVSFVTMWINSNSTKKDLALKYIESLIDQENSSPSYEYVLFKGRNQEVERPDYLTKVQELSAKKSELEQTMSMAEAAYREPFEQAIAKIDFDLEQLEKDRYLITDEGISRYASWVNLLKATSDSNYLSQNDSDDEFSRELGKLCDMFVQGAISKEQFVSQLNQISKLIYYERVSD